MYIIKYNVDVNTTQQGISLRRNNYMNWIGAVFFITGQIYQNEKRIVLRFVHKSLVENQDYFKWRTGAHLAGICYNTRKITKYADVYFGLSKLVITICMPK